MSALLKDLSRQGHAFAVFPEARIYEEPNKKSIQHLLFGDYITPPKNSSGTAYQKWSATHVAEVKGKKWIQARSRQVEGWIRMDELQLERTLEINFVDIGQGDGCHMVTPDDEHLIIDAGEKDNMYRFLRWRFNLAAPGGNLPKFSAVISHPDEDHWKGFEWLLSKPPTGDGRQIQIAELYHNGIIQRAGSTVGKVIVQNGRSYVSELIDDEKELKRVLASDGAKSNYEKFLQGAWDNFPALKIKSLRLNDTKSKQLYNKGGLEIAVLAPIAERVKNKDVFRWFDADTEQIGKTKNGHSVVLMATIGKMKIMLGGDLNSESADYLMEKYSGKDIRQLRVNIEKDSKNKKPALRTEMNSLIEKCAKTFRAEIAKSCHHGSSDITNEFLAAVNPIATVISSGDEESFCHPRPETLGAVGKFGRGERPLIFSTELARSSPEFFEFKTSETESDKKKQRIVATYGMITVRTDGEQAIIAQKLEKGRSQFGKLVKWHIDKIIWNDERREFISKK
jgi:beta-lactamase superfamily II metal-dependent hydrolase